METVAEDEVPRMVGPYRTVRPLGVGATGRVYLADRVEFAQRVAVKCFFSEFVSGGLVQDALREQDLLTLLDHPNIVRLIDQGVAEDGTRYLAMEYVNGVPIDEHADARRMTVAARVRLMLPVLEAVEYAHRHLVVHCDLKPANVLVTTEGQPKLLDFGAGALLERGLVGAGGAGLTRIYASPEQQTGGVVTVASDVYALGLMLREVVAGQGPSAPRDQRLSGLRAVAGTEVRSGARWAGENRLAEMRSTNGPALRVQLRGDLDAIVRKALQQRPEDRYGSVEEMRVDLERHLDGLPITARATGGVERGWLWVRRHKVASAMAAVLLMVVVGSVLGVAGKAALARRERVRAEQRLEDLVRMNGSLEGELYGSVANLPGGEDARKSLLTGATATLDSVSAAGTQDPRLALELAGQYEEVARLEAAAGRGAEARVSARKGLAVLGRMPGSVANEAEAGRLRVVAWK